jgi:hypothetical protein
MKPVLLLLPKEAGRPLCERRQFDVCRSAPAGVVDDTDYGSVIVLNDGSADAVRRLALALAMRRRWRALEVGLLTYLDGRALDRPPAALVNSAGRLRIELREPGLWLEYQADGADFDDPVRTDSLWRPPPR